MLSPQKSKSLHFFGLFIFVSFLPISCTVCKDKKGDASAAIHCEGNILKKGDINSGSIDHPEEVLIEANGQSFKIDKTEITHAQFASFLKEKQVTAAETTDGGSNDCDTEAESSAPCYDFSANSGLKALIQEDYSISDGGDDLPVYFVNWYGAQAYCEAVGKTLPDGDTWKLAATHGESRKYPWGDESPEGCIRANATLKDTTPNTTENKTFANCNTGPVAVNGADFSTGDTTQGLRHMAGNLAEWTSSGSTSEKTIKGGGWDSAVQFLTIESIQAAQPSSGFANVGFRCVEF